MNNYAALSRRDLLRRASIVGGLLSASLLVGGGAADATADGFRWCSRCQSLWFIGGGNNGHCPVNHWFDHSHYQDGSRFYFLRFDFEQGAGQTGWHWCRNCKAVYYLGQGESGAGRCPNNPSGATWHTQGDLVVRPDGQSFASFRMETETNNNGPGSVTRLQSGWRFCFKCNVMFFVNNGPEVTHCPAGGQHDQSRSDRYLMRDFTPSG